MVFSSTVFLFLFLPLVFLFYFIIPQRYLSLKNIVLIIFSLLFYFYGETSGVLIMLCSIAVNYLAALGLGESAPQRRRKASLYLGVVLNLALLCYYKYLVFLLDNLNLLFHASVTVPDIIMPIGISFFTFQGMSYLFDVYYRTVPVQRNPLYIALYISLFPQLIAGPIVRYQTVAGEISCRRTTLEDFAQGICRFIIGLAKKMLLANTMGTIAEEIFARDITALPALTAWIGIISFTFQIYYDFAGYSDMAIGLGRVFGFHFLENFDFPYISRSITEFWRRWHMSLGQWFRDYVYIPLGGNRRGFARQIVNILIVWGLTGIWHGASWNFLLWGLYFALLLILEKAFLGRLLEKLWLPLRHLYALFFILIGWVIFQLTSVGEIVDYLGAMFGRNSATDSNAILDLVYYGKEYYMEWIFAVLCAMPVFPAIAKKCQAKSWYPFAYDVGITLLFLLSVLALVGTTFNPFIYFRF